MVYELANNPSRWSMEVSEGHQLLDPISGKPMHPDRPSHSIADLPICRDGLDYLRNNADRITVTLGYTARRMTAADLGDVAEGHFEWEVDQADFYGFEHVGHHPDAHSPQAVVERVEAQSIATTNDYDALAADLQEHGIAFDTFSLRIFKAILSAPDTHSFSPDLSQRRSGIESMLLTAYARFATSLEDQSQDKAALLGLSNDHEWMMLANLGNEMQSSHAHLGAAAIRVFNTVSRGRTDLKRKLNLLGIETQEEQLGPAPHESRAVAATISSVLSTGVLTKIQAAKLPLDTLRRVLSGQVTQ